MKRVFFPVVITFLLVLTGCSQVQVLSIKSMEKDKEFYKGREVSFKTDENVTTELEVDGVSSGKIYFYLYIRNKSDRPIEIRPEEMYLKTYCSMDDLNNGNSVWNWAYDPESAIEEIKEDMNKAEDRKNLSTGLNSCLSLFSFISHISSDDDNDHLEAVDDVANFAVTQAAIESDYKSDMKDLHSEKEFWRNEVLRRTILNSGDEIGGIVVMPILAETKYVRVTIPFKAADHTYLFEFVKTKRKNK